MDAIRSLARRIELLHPQVDDNGTVPANTEYPWLGPDGKIIVPAEYDFAVQHEREPVFITMIKEVHARAKELAIGPVD